MKVGFYKRLQQLPVHGNPGKFMSDVGVFFFLTVISFGCIGGEVRKPDFATRLTDSTYALDQPLADSTATVKRSGGDTFKSSLTRINSALDEVMHAVDPLQLFPRLSSMGTVTLQKGYLFLLIGFLVTGGVMIFIAETIHGRRKRRARRKRAKANRVVGGFKMQVAFEEFVMTLFDPLYFRCRSTRPQAVLADQAFEGETPVDLDVEFSHRDTYARFVVKCLYFTSTAKGDVRLFYATTGDNQDDIPRYFVLGFGGTPDDPKELFLLPAEVARRGVVSKALMSPYSKSGMFFYNSVSEKLQ